MFFLSLSHCVTAPSSEGAKVVKVLRFFTPHLPVYFVIGSLIFSGRAYTKRLLTNSGKFVILFLTARASKKTGIFYKFHQDFTMQLLKLDKKRV